MTLYYDKQGQPLEMLEWARLVEPPKELADSIYKRVAETTLPDGKWVSTVWLGLDHRLGVGPPLIFETMVFDSKDALHSLGVARYSTLAEAEAGHIAMVTRWSSTSPQA